MSAVEELVAEDAVELVERAEHLLSSLLLEVSPRAPVLQRAQSRVLRPAQLFRETARLLLATWYAPIYSKPILQN